ncbi:DUF1587 domain-containing protein, partial [Akkermansiaceae bacterium]|nr:DUF1587 domain-containing protein [Akkermansiaceae bacterium]
MLNQRITKLAVLLLLVTGAQISSIVADERMQSQHFFNTFCVSCHGPEKSKGGLRLDQIDLKKWNDPSLLDDIYTAIESEEMPPEDAPKRPEIDQIKLLEKVLGNQLYRLTEEQKPGMLKRLSRIEYQNTVNDVFGTDFSLIDRLPLDSIEAGFNNNADNLHMSVVDMESYFNVANFISESVVSDKPAPRTIVYSTKDTDIDTHSHKDNTNGFAPTLSLNSRPLVFATQSIQIKINPSVKTSGVYRIVPEGFYIQANFVAGNRAEERLPAVKEISEINANEKSATDHSMSYFLRKNSGVGQSIVTVIPKNAAWQDFDPSIGFTTKLSSDDTIVL